VGGQQHHFYVTRLPQPFGNLFRILADTVSAAACVAYDVAATELPL